MNVALTDLITNLPKSNNANNFSTNGSNTKLESFDQKLQDIFSNVEKESLGFKKSPMPEKEVINNKLSVTLNTIDSKDLIISNTKKNKNIKLNVDQLLLLIEASTKNTKNINEKELLNQAQKLLSSSKTEFTEAELEVLQKALSIITKENKVTQGSDSEESKASNSQISLDGLIKRSQSTQTSSDGLIKHSKPIEESPYTLSQNNLHSKGSQETTLLVQADIQKLLSTMEESSKSIENKNEINILEEAQKILISSKAELTKEDKRELLNQAQKILSSSQIEFTQEDKEVLQKALSIIIKESKDSQGSNSEDSKAINSQTSLDGLIKRSQSTQTSLDGLIKHSKSTEETSPPLSQNNLHSKDSQEANQIVNSDIQKLLSTMEESSKSIEDKDEINTLEEAQKILISSKAKLTKEDKAVLLIQAQKLLSSSKIEFTEAELEVLQKAFSIIIKESKASNSQISLEDLIKHTKSTEETSPPLSQNNLHSKDSQEAQHVVQADIQKLLSTMEESSKSIEDKNEINILEEAQKILISSKAKLTKEDKRELLNQVQEILSSSQIEFTQEDKEVLQKALSIIIKESKESKASNGEISSEGLIKHSKSTEESPNIMLQYNLHSKAKQETQHVVQADIQKLLQLIEESSKSMENNDEINILEEAQKILISSKAELTEEDKEVLLIQAQKLLSSSKTQFTEEDKKVLQEALNIIIKESKTSNSQISLDGLIKCSQSTQTSLDGLIKHSKSIEEITHTLTQNNLHSKATQEANQIVNSDIQKLLQLIEESSKSIENKNEINTLEQAQKILISSKAELTKEDKEVLLIQAQEILSSSKTEFTTDELNIIKTALGIINTNNSKMGNPSSNTLGETTLITNSMIKGNTDKTKNNKNENNDSIKSPYFDQKADLLSTKNNLGKNVYFDPYETRKNNVSKDKNSELQKVNAVKLTPTSNLGDISKNLNIEQLKTTPSTNEIDLKSLQINKNNIQDGISTTNLKDLNAQIKEVIISKNTQTFLNESFSVKISPPDLGKVDIQILKNGQAVTVNISTETENAKNIISKTLQSLVGNLRDEGYQPISIKVNVTQEEHYLADQNQQHQQEQEQKKHREEDQKGDQPEEGTYYTFEDYLRSDLNA